MAVPLDQQYRTFLSPDLQKAIALMENDMTLPLDLIARLIEQGVDVDEMERLHRPKPALD